MIVDRRVQLLHKWSMASMAPNQDFVLTLGDSAELLPQQSDLVHWF